MTALESHPLRITDRDLLKEVSQDEWFTSFKGLDLHIRVSAGTAAAAAPGATTGVHMLHTGLTYNSSTEVVCRATTGTFVIKLSAVDAVSA